MAKVKRSGQNYCDKEFHYHHNHILNEGGGESTEITSARGRGNTM